ncbi:MAG TPA: hypothetical protein HPP66_04810 [Planctomycetes bacterium]|nr:hypothetical protein [Planctomycetota bacterium]
MNCVYKQMSCKVRFVCVALLFIAYHSASSNCWGKVERVLMPATMSYDWRQTDSSVAVLNRGRVVWQVNFDKKEGKPYLHPVGLTDGTVLTCLRPADHRWHRALWFSWKFINGLNYWEEDPKTGLSQGRTEVVDVKVRPHRDRSGDIEMTLSYHPPGEQAVLMEKRLLAVSAPDENGRYHIDWHSTFTAREKDVLLDRTPIPGEKGGKGFGGYAGLSVRMAKATRGWQFTDSEGRKDKEAHGKKARWVDFSGEIGEGKAAGIAIFDHPENLRHPSPWYVTKDMPYFSPAVLFNKPYTLGAGKSLTLRYRILIHPGRADRDMLEGELKAFLKTTDIEVRMESAKKLSALGRAMVTYSGDYGFKFPDMRALHKYGNLKKKDLDWLLENVVYLGKGKTYGTIRPDTVFAYDKTLLDKGGCTNVLFGDLRVEFLKPEQLEKLGIRKIEERKAAIRVDLLVCEVYADAEIDWETAVGIKNLVGEEKGLSPAAVLKNAVRKKQVPKDKLDSLVDLLASKSYLKILMNPTLEVVDGKTAKIRSSYKGPTGKDIIDSFEITPRILDDGCISLETELIIEGEALRQGEEEIAVETGLRISNKENRIKDSGSLIIGGVTKTEKRAVVRGVPVLKDIPLIDRLFSRRDFEVRTKQILAVVTASISEGD